MSVSSHDYPSKYMVIKNTDEKGATVIDAQGEEQTVDRDFIISHWGGQVSWLYPMPKKTATLMRGGNAPEILELQKTLNNKGYMVKTNREL